MADLRSRIRELESRAGLLDDDDDRRRRDDLWFAAMRTLPGCADLDRAELLGRASGMVLRGDENPEPKDPTS